MEDFDQMLKYLQKVHAKAQQMQQDLTHLQATGEAGAGAVKATVDGNKLMLKLEIDEEYIRPDEKEILQDLIIAATNSAHRAIEEKMREEINWGQFMGNGAESIVA